MEDALKNLPDLPELPPGEELPNLSNFPSLQNIQQNLPELPNLPDLPQLQDLTKTQFFGTIAVVVIAILAPNMLRGYVSPWSKIPGFIPYVSIGVSPPANAEFCKTTKQDLSVLFDYQNYNQVISDNRVMVSKAQYVVKYSKTPPSGAKQWYFSVGFSGMKKPMAVMFDLLENKIYTAPIVNRSLARTVKSVMSGGAKKLVSVQAFDPNFKNRKGDSEISIGVFLVYDHQQNLVNVFSCQAVPDGGAGKDLFYCTRVLRGAGPKDPYFKTMVVLDHRVNGAFKKVYNHQQLNAWCTIHDKENFGMLCKGKNNELSPCETDVDLSLIRAVNPKAGENKAIMKKRSDGNQEKKGDDGNQDKKETKENKEKPETNEKK